MHLFDLLSSAAGRAPDREALVCGQIRLNWSSLLDQVLRLAAGLRRAGIGPGDTVMLWLPTSPCFVVSFFAVLARGAVPMPLNPAIKRGDLPPAIGRPAAVLTLQRLNAACTSALRADVITRGVSVLACPDEQDCLGWDLLGESALAPEPVCPDAPALVQYSSGSTGQPKRLRRSHRQCAAEAAQTGATLATTGSDVFFCALPLFHAHGLANALWAATSCAGTLVLAERPDPIVLHRERILRVIEEERVTILPGVPFLFNALSEAGEGVDLTSVRLCFSAGAPLTDAVFRRFLDRFGVPIRQLYGCTEAGAVSINLDAQAQRSVASVGTTMHGVEVTIRDEDDQLLPAGELGEICLTSGALACGYDDDEVLSQARFRDGRFRTGDIGRKNADGALTVVGRKELAIGVAGHKVYANEIEAVLEQHPGVREAAVKGVAHASLGESVHAFVVTDGTVTPDALAIYCKANLPSYKRPREITVVAALRHTASGKLDRSELP